MFQERDEKGGRAFLVERIEQTKEKGRGKKRNVCQEKQVRVGDRLAQRCREQGTRVGGREEAGRFTMLYSGVGLVERKVRREEEKEKRS